MERRRERRREGGREGAVLKLPDGAALLGFRLHHQKKKEIDYMESATHN